MTRLRPTFAALLLVLAGVSATHAITLTPSTAVLAQGNETSEAAIQAIIGPLMGSATELYKATRSDGSESGSFASSYATDFSNTPPLLPSSALITFTGGSAINSSPAYAFIRDGNYTNFNWYLFNISGWNGTDDVAFSGFFPLEGGTAKNISHVALYGTSTITRIPGTPDGGTTILMLGGVLVGFAAFTRRFRK